MEQVLAIPFNFNWQARRYFKYIAHRTGLSGKMVAIPVLSGVAYAERYIKSGKLLICDIDNSLIQFAIIKKELDSSYEVKKISGFYRNRLPLNNNLTFPEIENWIMEPTFRTRL